MAKTMINRNTTLLRSPTKRDILPSILLFIAERASVMGVFPFGTAFFAACCDKDSAYISITIMYLSLLSAGAAGVTVKYTMAALIFWLFIKLYYGKKSLVEAVACGGAVFISGMASMLYTFSGLYDIILLFIESVISGVMYAVFSIATNAVENKRHASSQEELLSVSAVVGVLILGLGKTMLPYNISVANIITAYVTLAASLNTSIAGASLVGLILGFITGADNEIIMMGALGLSAVFGAFLKGFGRFGTALGFLGGACAVLLYGGEVTEFPYSVYDVLIAAALFALTPNFIQQKISSFIGGTSSIEAIKDSKRLRLYLSDRLTGYARSFRELEKTFCRASDKRMELNSQPAESIIEETAQRVCLSCTKCSRCWEKDKEKTIEGIAGMMCILEQKGTLELNMLPLSLREQCIRSERLMQEAQHCYELFKIDLAQDGERLNNRDAITMQYRETAEILENLSKELEVDFCGDSEDEAVRAFEHIGINVYEISITEGEFVDVYLRLSDNSRIEEAEKILSDIMCVNIVFDKDYNNGLHFVSRPRFGIEVGAKQISKEDICGDSVRIFGAGDYKLYCIICDGMGVGKNAAEESGITASLLERFLTAGFSIRTSVELINSSMCIKNDVACFTTLDLLCIDLMNGCAEFYKIGAAQSFIYRGGSFETVFSAAFPIGAMPYAEVLPQVKRVEDGDIFVMASDGITEAGEIKTEWLKNSIKAPFSSMQSMSEEIAARALKRNGGSINDDMSVIALKITEN